MADYEAEREDNIRRNKAMLHELGLLAPMGSLATPPLESVRPPVTIASWSGWRQQKSPAVGKAQGRKEPMAAVVTSPSRASSRLRGLPAMVPSATLTTGSSNETTAVEGHADVDEPAEDHLSGALVTAEEFFPPDVVARAIRVDSHYRGWINPKVQMAHGFDSNAAEAWAKNGGGKFSFRNPLGVPEGEGNSRKGKAGRQTSAGAPAGWSEARFVSFKLFRKNPNAYFYRHTEPGIEQWQGEWYPEEKEQFLWVAKTFGCGDKWGLFSTYLPHRVGYQCSNYYRQVILPEGLIIDPNYKLTRLSGHAIYGGPHMRNQRE